MTPSIRAYRAPRRFIVWPLVSALQQCRVSLLSRTTGPQRGPSTVCRSTGTLTAPPSLLDSCPSVTNCVVLASENSSGTNDQVLYTRDGGTTWLQTSLPTAQPGAQVAEGGALSCPSIDTCVAGSLSAGLIHSVDGGATWSAGTVPSPAPGGIIDIACASSTSCTAVGGSGTVLLSTDGGASWSVGTPPANQVPLISVSCSSASDCAAVSGDNTSDLPFTNDAGTTWMSGTAPFEVQPNGGHGNVVSCTNAGHCVFLGTSTKGQGSVAYAAAAFSADGGATWSSGSVPSQSKFNVQAISCPTSMRCIAVGDLPPGAAYTSDGGRSWILPGS